MPAEIPWGYGVDRLGAMAVDPERLFVYWELTDAAIERARKRADDAQAPVVLRVYETTGRIFDGTNAHDHFDHEIDRADRRWFFDINKPGSEVVVELGLLLDDDRFVKIVRSSRVEFPRAEPLAPSTPSWLTVRVHEGRPEPMPERVHPLPGARHEWPPPPAQTSDRTPTSPALDTAPPAQQAEQRTVFRPQEPASWNSWESGPSTTQLETAAPWTESYSGETRFYRDGPHTRVVTGPWEVVIRGIGASRRREVLAHWEIHRSWVTEEGAAVQHDIPGSSEPRPGSSELARPGSSERRWLAGSEERLSGSSELLYLGASERRLGGASERLLRGASERRLGGASERAPRGASERRFRGGSERLYRGASERRLSTTAVRRKPEGAPAYPHVEAELDDE